MAGAAAGRPLPGRAEPVATVGGLSPEIRILEGGEPRLLTDLGRIDPGSLESYRAHGGYAALGSRRLRNGERRAQWRATERSRLPTSWAPTRPRSAIGRSRRGTRTSWWKGS